MHALFTATHSMMSTYFGSMTIVLKFPFTSAASTKGLERYKALGIDGTDGDWGEGGWNAVSVGERVADVGVGDRFGAR